MVCAGVLPAHADLSIAKAPTSNVRCTGASCVATAPTAVLNVADLRHLLAKYPHVSVDAAVAKNMTVDATLSWTTTVSLALTASGSLIVNKPVTVAGSGGVSIQSSQFFFAGKASLSFWDVGSGLTINHEAYTLVPDIKTLAADIRGRSDRYALAHDYDAAADGTYIGSPIYGFSGMFDGLGHSISNFSMNGSGDSTGFISRNWGVLQNLSLDRAHMEGTVRFSGLLAGENHGIINRVRVTGEMLSNGGDQVGGLVGLNECVESCAATHAPPSGVISNSHANVRIVGSVGNMGGAGGLVGQNAGLIRSSYAEGGMEVGGAQFLAAGLVGQNDYRIENSYSLVRIHVNNPRVYYGGLIALQLYQGGGQPYALNSYAAGKVEGARKSAGVPGGVVGFQYGYDPTKASSNYTNVYWDTDTGVHNVHKGVGNLLSQPGLTGLSDAALKSGLPAGFDPAIWGQSPDINDGYPYLRSNPPR
ncbi:MAG: hypothetical protein ACJ8IR_12610 [Alphaproteobacteria bacterium]